MESLMKLINLMVKYMIKNIDVVIFVLIGVSVILCFIFIWIYNRYKKLAQRKNIPYSLMLMAENFCFVLPLTWATIISSQISRFIVQKALHIWHKKLFKKLLNGQDPLYVEKYPQQTVVPVLFLVNCKGDAEEFYTRIRQHFNNCAYNLAKCEKFFGTVESWNRYYYIKNETTDINKYIKKLRVLPGKEVIDKEDLLLLLEEYYALPLPKFNKALWQVFIGMQPVEWTTTQQSKLYPIMFKFSHCLCDQENFMKTILETFSDNKNLQHIALPLRNPSLVSSFITAFGCVCFWLKGLPLLLVNSALLKFNRNVLVGAELGTKKYFCIDKNDSKTLFIKVNDIKRKADFKTNLSCIFETAIVSSLSEFYQKYSYAKTEKDLVYVTTMNENDSNSFTCLPIDSLKCEKNGISKNAVKFMLLSSPILKLSDLRKSKMIMTTLKHISSLKEYVQEFGEPEMTRRLFSGSFNYFPDVYQKYLTRHTISPPTIVSNLTAPSSEISINGLVVEDIYGWCPNFRKTGITFAICSYRNISHITLNADANLIGSMAEAQDLLDKVYKYIDLMYNSIV